MHSNSCYVFLAKAELKFIFDNAGDHSFTVPGEVSKNLGPQFPGEHRKKSGGALADLVFRPSDLLGKIERKSGDAT
jgi:hypothetical protein